MVLVSECVVTERRRLEAWRGIRREPVHGEVLQGWGDIGKTPRIRREVNGPSVGELSTKARLVCLRTNPMIFRAAQTIALAAELEVDPPATFELADPHTVSSVAPRCAGLRGTRPHLGP